jgi:hypothetical protein
MAAADTMKICKVSCRRWAFSGLRCWVGPARIRPLGHVYRKGNLSETTMRTADSTVLPLHLPCDQLGVSLPADPNQERSFNTDGLKWAGLTPCWFLRFRAEVVPGFKEIERSFE